MNVIDEPLWKKCRDNNPKGYGKAINDYAERWANLMEKKMAKGHALKDIAEDTSNKADTEGITGFMYGAAVATLVGVWEHGAELKKWHNGQYGQPDAEGVVNPAILNIQT